MLLQWGKVRVGKYLYSDLRRSYSSRCFSEEKLVYMHTYWPMVAGRGLFHYQAHSIAMDKMKIISMKSEQVPAKVYARALPVK